MFQSKKPQSAADLMRQSMAQLRTRNREQLALLVAQYQQLQKNVAAAGGDTSSHDTDTTETVAEGESFDFWEDEPQTDDDPISDTTTDDDVPTDDDDFVF